MKQLFKTSLLAVTIAATCGTAFAGTVTVTKQTHSIEGLAGVTATQISNDIAYVVAAAYAVGDKITFTFPAGALDATTFPSQINVAAVDGDGSAAPVTAVAGMGLGLLNSTANAVTYRVTTLSQPLDTNTGLDFTNRTTIGASIDLGPIGYLPAALTAAAVTVTVSSQTSVGDVLDSAGVLTAIVADSDTQYGTAAVGTQFDAVINVSSARKAFVGVTSDSMDFTITNPNVLGADMAAGGTGVNADWLNLATTTSTGVTVFGEAGRMTGLDASNWTTAGTDTFTVAAATLAVSYAGMVTNDTITFTPTAGVNADVLESQDFTTDVVYNYTSGAVKASKTVGVGLDSGEWTLNGASVNIPYMPYGDAISQIMYVSNDGDQSGDIVVTAFDDAGNTYDLGTVKIANANTVTKITSEVKDALELAGFTNGRVSITVTVNAPADDVTVYASYHAGGTRGFVNTDQYKGM